MAKKLQKRQSTKSQLTTIKTKVAKTNLNKNSVANTQPKPWIIPQSVWRLAWGIGLGIFIIYFITLYRQNSAYGFSDELLATAYRFGLTRPPGQIFYTLILHFVTNLPIPGSVAFRGALLSVILQSCAFVLFVPLYWFVTQYFINSNAGINKIVTKYQLDKIAIVIVALLLACSKLFWEYATIAELPAFSNFLLAGSLLLTFRLFLGDKNEKIWLLLSLVFAISVVTNPAFVFGLPLIVWPLWQQRKNLSILLSLKMFAILGAVAGLNYFLIRMVSSSSSFLNWELPAGLSGFWHYLSNNDFGQNQLYYQMGQHLVDSAKMYAQNLVTNIGPLLIIMLLLGVYNLWQINKKLCLYLSLGSISFSIFLPILLSWSDERWIQMQILRQYNMVWMPFGIFIVAGLMLVLTRLVKAYLVLDNRGRWMLIPALLGLVILILGPFNNWKQIKLNQQRSKIFNRVLQQTLSQLPVNSLFICANNLVCNALFYHQQVDGLRSDVDIIADNYPIESKHYLHSDIKGFAYQNPIKNHFDFITWNMGRRKVYATGLTPQYFDILGMNYGFLYYLPKGYTGEIYSMVADYNYDSDIGLRQNIVDLGNELNDPNFIYQTSIIAQIHFINSLAWQKMGMREKARSELNIASNLLYKISGINAEQVEKNRTDIESMSPAINWAPGSTQPSLQQVLIEVDKYLEYKRINSALSGSLGMVAMNPRNVEARLKLAQVFDLAGDRQSSIIEYQNVLKLDPENSEAKAKISLLAN